MRHLYIILVALMTAGCASVPVYEMPRHVNARGYDFSEYTDKGFLFTPLKKTGGKYQSIGLISVTLWPAVKKGNMQMEPNAMYGNFKARRVQGEMWLVEDINTDEAIDSTYSLARGMGADAIIQFDIGTTSRHYGALEVTGISVSGFAIDRKNHEPTTK